MDLLQLAGYGMDAIGLAVGGWYTSVKVVERAMKMDAPLVESLVAKPPSAAARPSGPGSVPGPSSVGPAGDKDSEPEREKLLRLILKQTELPSAAARPFWPGPMPGPLSAYPAGDKDAEPEAEKLLGAKLEGFSDPVFGLGTGWLGWLWRRLALLGWLRLAIVVPFALVLFAVSSVLYGAVLPFAVVGFLFDSGKDFRLRIIVLAFAAGICLQIVDALPG